MADPAQIRIDIVSDVVCPWCVIGFKQLERAIGAIGDKADVSVRWHAYELAPAMPPEGQLLTDYVRERYGAGPEQSQANRARMQAMGEELGIAFNWNDASRMYNSNKAHQLLAWAGEIGGQTALKTALFDAYFTDQADIGDEAVLLAAAKRAGLDTAEAAEVLADGRYADHVRSSEAYWRDQNVTGVPAYIINGTYMIPGAQDAGTFAQIIEKAIERGVGV